MTIIRNMTCPKCGGRMRSFERSRLMVEQCELCRGFFLDYGELERLIDAEGGGWSGRVGPPPEVADPLSARPASRATARHPGSRRVSDPVGIGNPDSITPRRRGIRG
jgi:Zn-finger nucleic acid-binding protein